MMKTFRHRLLQLVLPACALLAATAAIAREASIDAAGFRQDIAFIRQTIARAHPDPNFSVRPQAIDKALDTLAAGAPPTMTRDEAWRRLATLNPLFADAHLLVGLADWRAESMAHLAAGGTLFPYEVAVGTGGWLTIRALLGGTSTPLAGTRIVAIDGVPAASTVEHLATLVHGDTPPFRANLLARRWWLYYWKTHGNPTRYRLLLDDGARTWTMDVPGATAVPQVLRDDADFARQFRFEIHPGSRAVLTAGSFDAAFQDRFVQFTRTAFARMRDEGVTELTIDISDNGGGDDAMWLDGLMPYLATRPYRTGSTYVKMVAEPDTARGERAGQVVQGEIGTWRQPEPDSSMRFQGKVVVAIGPSTYSSAVLFANVMQDFGFGTLAGAGGAARRTQSGGVRKFMLPHSGLALWVPRFILAPPSGAARDALLVPAS